MQVEGQMQISGTKLEVGQNWKWGEIGRGAKLEVGQNCFLCTKSFSETIEAENPFQWQQYFNVLNNAFPPLHKLKLNMKLTATTTNTSKTLPDERKNL